MYKIVFTVIVYCASFSLFATNYFVSNSSGNDNNNGLSPETAWKTLLKIESEAKIFRAGDIIAFRKGDTWEESLILYNIHGSSGNPIIFTSYGSGDKPILKGSKEISGWRNIGNNIWEAHIETGEVYDIPSFINARIPDIVGADDRTDNYLEITSVQNSKLQFSCSDLIGNKDLIGSTIQIRLRPFARVLGIISDFDSSTGKITVSDNIHSSHKFEVGQEFWIQNHYNLLSAQNEWYYDSKVNKLFVYSTTVPKPLPVTLNKGNGVTITDSNYLEINNLNIKNYNSNGIRIESDSNHNFINNNDISFCKENGISLYSASNNIVSNNVIDNISSVGIKLEGAPNSVIESNIVGNIYLLNNISCSTNGNDNSGIYISRLSINTIIRNNRIKNIGFNGISFYHVTNLTIDKNFVENTCLNMEDGGAIYGSNDSTDSKSIITNNIAIGYPNFVNSNWDVMGIYLDDNSHNWTVVGNSIKGNHRGIFSHNNQNNTFTGNKVYNSVNETILISNDNYGDNSSGNVFNNNEVYIESETYLPIKIHNKTDTFWNFVSTNNNKYYNPMSYKSVEFQTLSIDNKDFTLLDWQAFSNQDVNSIEDDLPNWENGGKSQFIYNETNKTKTIPLDGSWWDLSGNKYNGSISLEPYTSSILINQKIDKLIGSIDANAGSDQTICSGESVTLTASGGSSYSWNTGATTKSITVNPTETTVYTVTVSERSVSDSDTVTVAVSSVTANAGNDTTIYEGESVTLTASGGGSYIWNTGATTQSITIAPTTTTIYTVTAKKGDCEDTDAVQVTVNKKDTSPPPAKANAGEDQTICLGDHIKLTASGGSTYAWSTGAITKSIYVDPIRTTSYTVTATRGGVTNSDVVVVTVENCSSIGGSEQQEELHIYPNPTSGIINISVKNVNEEFSLFVSDEKGSIVYSEEAISESDVFHKKMDLSRFKKGLYFVCLNGANINKVKKLLVVDK